MSRALRRKLDGLALAVLGVLALAFWGNCLWGGRVPVAAVYQRQMLPWAAVSPADGQTRQWDSLLWDSMAQFYPWRLLLHRAAREGRLPLWNPHQFCGYPFVGNGQSALFYPPNWLYLVVHPNLGLGLSAALHYFLAGLFVFGLARCWGLGRLPALFAALAFTYGGFMVAWIELPTLVNSLVWLPLAWWGLEVICRSAAPASSASPRVGLLMLAGALGLALLAGHLQIAAYVWIFAALYAAARLPALLRFGARVAGRALGLTLAAVALAGLLAAVQVLPTLELGRYSTRGAGGPSAAGFAFHHERALQPVELLTLLAPDLFGSPVSGDYQGISYSEHCGFVGAVTVALLFVGLLLGRRRGAAWLFGGVALFALWGALAGPPALLLYWGVPKLGQAGGFPRLLSVWTLAAALGAGVGLQVLQESLRPRSGLGAARPATAGRVVCGLALVLLLAQELPWAYRFNPRAPAGSVYPETEAIRQLRSAVGQERYLAANPREVWTLLQVPTGALLPPNAATVYGLHALDGYDSLFPAAYRRLAAQREGTDPSPLSNGNMLLLSSTASWSPVRCLLTREEQEAPRDSFRSAVWAGEGCALYRQEPDLVARVQVWTHRDMVSSSLLPLAGRPAPSLTELPGDLTVGLPSGTGAGVLCVAESPYPGWRAALDGRPVPLRASTDGARWELPLAGGETRAQLVYYPAGVAAGLFLSLLAAAALACLGVVRPRGGSR